MIRGPTSVGRFRAGKTQVSKIELLYEVIDQSDRIALGNPILKPLWKQHALPRKRLARQANRRPCVDAIRNKPRAGLSG